MDAKAGYVLNSFQSFAPLASLASGLLIYSG